MLKLTVILALAATASALAQAQRDQKREDGPVHPQPEYRETIEVDHTYYNLKLYKNGAGNKYEEHLVDMTDSRVHDFLSNHAQAAEAVSPGFNFPFYGHNVDTFFITTHGFLSFAPRLHNLMYKTQYIAPLRVKLDPSASEDATIRYKAVDDALTIEWTNVSVAEPYKHPRGGNFTFQTTLKKDGTIVFVYESIPELLAADALYDGEPVAGLSDAFLIGDSELHVYHTLSLDNADINSKTVAVFTAKKTCVSQDSCKSCMDLRDSSEFECVWCDKVQRCSDGADRLREHWDANLCPASNSSSADQCGRTPAAPKKGHTEWRTSMGVAEESEPETSDLDGGDQTSTAVVVTSTVVCLVLILILGAIGAGYVWVYGRSNPGGMAERIANRLESNYNRFGGKNDLDQDDDSFSVEMERAAKAKQEAMNNNNNNNNANNNVNSDGSITVNF